MQFTRGFHKLYVIDRFLLYVFSSFHSNQFRIKMNLNPFENDLIADTLLSKLSLKDLLNCRSVLPQWSYHPKVISEMRKITISFGDPGKVCTELKRLEKFVQVMKNSTYLPYINFSISFLPLRDPIVEEFFNICGISMKFISLTMSLEEMNTTQFQELLFYKVPNLEKLEIGGLSRTVCTQGLQLLTDYDVIPTKLNNLKCFVLQESRCPLVDLLRDFFQLTPHLQTIIFGAAVRTDWNSQAEIFCPNSKSVSSVLEALKYSPYLNSLKEFRCGILNQKNLTNLIELSEKGLQLEILDMKSVGADVKLETFNIFLQTQEKSLKYFRISRRKSLRSIHQPQQFHIQFPSVMTTLRTLHLTHKHRDIPVAVYPISYANQFSNLESLYIAGWSTMQSNLSEYFSSHANQMPCITMKKVTLPVYLENNFPFTLVGLFPNLTDLHITNPTNQFLKNLWEAFSKLVVLKITTGSDTSIEAGLTGLDEEIIEQLSKRTLPIVDFHNFLTKGNTSIANLIDLRKIEIEIDLEDKSQIPSTVTDITCHIAFSKMSQLQTLRISAIHWQSGEPGYINISSECRESLGNCLSRTVLDFGPLH